MSEEWKVIEVDPNGITVAQLVALLDGVDPSFNVYFSCRQHSSLQLVSGVNISHLQQWFALLPVGQDYDYFKNEPGCNYQKVIKQ